MDKIKENSVKKLLCKILRKEATYQDVAEYTKLPGSIACSICNKFISYYMSPSIAQLTSRKTVSVERYSKIIMDILDDQPKQV